MPTDEQEILNDEQVSSFIMNTDDSELSAGRAFLESLQDFYNSYIVETANGSFQVFQSFTYGEMAIVLSLLILIFLFLAKWVYEVLR